MVNLALRQFGISEHSGDLQNISCSNYSLCEVSVGVEQGGLVKQKRLPETASNLSERIGVHSRYAHCMCAHSPRNSHPPHLPPPYLCECISIHNQVHSHNYNSPLSLISLIPPIFTLSQTYYLLFPTSTYSSPILPVTFLTLCSTLPLFLAHQLSLLLFSISPSPLPPPNTYYSVFW